jgi:hypothetical protein
MECIIVYTSTNKGACGVTGGVQSILDQLKAAGLSEPATSLLRPANAILDKKGFLAGAFLMEHKRSRRNSTIVVLDNDIMHKIKTFCHKTGISLPTAHDAVRFEAGIKMNGHSVARGHVCLSTKIVPRTCWNTAGDDIYRTVCTILAFYLVQCDDKEEMFVEVVVVPTVSRYRALHILPRAGLGLTGFSSIIIHVDLVIMNMHICPHFTDNALVCAVPMWETR